LKKFNSSENQCPGPNPTASIYNASVEKFTTQLIAWHIFRVKIIFLQNKNVLAFYNAGVVAVNSKVVGLAPGKIRSHNPRIKQLKIDSFFGGKYLICFSQNLEGFKPVWLNSLNGVTCHPPFEPLSRWPDRKMSAKMSRNIEKMSKNVKKCRKMSKMSKNVKKCPKMSKNVVVTCPSDFEYFFCLRAIKSQSPKLDCDHVTGR
jgi:hypothetical protein